MIDPFDAPALALCQRQRHGDFGIRLDATYRRLSDAKEESLMPSRAEVMPVTYDKYETVYLTRRMRLLANPVAINLMV